MTDDDGAESSASETLFVDIRPEVDLDVVYADGFTIALSAANPADPDGGGLTYDWIFCRHGEYVSDTVAIRHAYEVDVTHIFDAAGEYSVYLGVTDDEGLTASTFHHVQIPIGG